MFSGLRSIRKSKDRGNWKYWVLNSNNYLRGKNKDKTTTVIQNEQNILISGTSLIIFNILKYKKG